MNKDQEDNGDVTIQEFDLQKYPKILKEFLTTEWDMVDTEHFGEVTRLYSKKRFIFVVRNQATKKIVGYAVLETNMGVATIESVVFKKLENIEDLGRDLIKHIIGEARKKECHVIKLETGTHWQSREMYEELGFKIRAVLPDYYGDQEHVLMDMRLRGGFSEEV
ncbi:GNAT family N-acetyltransferase [Candidatus Parcubacteria bacterium]|nr:GNAT family N-acetyltransferase [Candidatus Parcubacteria bacterium]